MTDFINQSIESKEDSLTAFRQIMAQSKIDSKVNSQLSEDKEVQEYLKTFHKKPIDEDVTKYLLPGQQKALTKLVDTEALYNQFGTDYLIGVMSEYEPFDIKNWVESASKIQTTRMKKAMIVYNAKAPVIQYLLDNQIAVWAISNAGPEHPEYRFFFKPSNSFNVCIERFFHAWLFLQGIQEKNDLGRVIITDVRDVVFQENPFEWLSQHWEKDKNILVTSESLTYANEPWGRNNMEKSFGQTIYQRMADKEIYNAGVIAGRGKTFLDFLFSVYFVARGSQQTFVEGGGGPDQAAMNLVLSQEPWKIVTQFVSSESGFAAQAGTTNDPSKSELMKHLLTMPPKLFRKSNKGIGNPSDLMLKDGVLNSLGKRFAIVHQYDRVPEWNNYFNGKQEEQVISNESGIQTLF